MSRQVNAAIAAIAVIIPLLSFGVWNSEASIIENSQEKSKIVAIASFYPLYEFTKELGGDKVAVSLLVPNGIEPHDWEPSIRDIQRIEKADLVIINGNGFENWVEKIDSSKITIINSGKSFGWLNEENSDSVDFHYWLNPLSAKLQIQAITDGLIKIDPENSNYYKNRKNIYDLKLDELHIKIKNELRGCKKDFITFHDSFSYFAHEYDLNQHTIIQSNDPHSEPTLKKLENIIQLANSLGINVIFAEEGMKQRTSQVIADELDGKVLVLSSLEIVSDNSSYIQKMENNLSNLKEALCK